jgi:hypothetical protein
MLHVSLITLALFSGVLVGPFPLAQAEPDHHQVMVRAAMAPDGRFAVAWVDSLRIIEGNPPYQVSETDIYVRFFNPQGEPLSDAYKIPKAVDTNWVFEPCLDMDSAGNTILVWHEAPIRLSTHRDIRYQSFNFGAVPASPPKTLKNEMRLSFASHKPIHADLNQKGEIALAWSQIVSDSFFRQQVWVQRFSYQGEPLDTAFMAHKEKSSRYDYIAPRAALNDEGYVVVTWLHFIETGHMFPLFQVFTPDDEPLFPEDTLGCRIDENPDLEYGASRPEPHASTNANGQYGTKTYGDNFVFTSPRSYYNFDNPSEPVHWNHCGGIIGKVADNEPVRRTTYFEYTPEWYPDTMNCFFDYRTHPVAPAVACCNDRIVWMYSRLNTDSIFEAFATISDWDMGVGIEEPPVVIQSPIRLSTMFNRLSYDIPGEARLILYSADGRRILEETIEGKGTWVAPIGFPSGVYFARVEGESAAYTGKVVLVR